MRILTRLTLCESLQLFMNSLCMVITETTVRVGEMAAELETVRENQRTLIHQGETRNEQTVISDTKITSEGKFL